VNDLKELFENDKEKLLLINQLEELIDKRISLATRLIEIRRDKGQEEVLAFFATASGKKEMEQIRTIVDRMTADEDARLDTEKEINRANIHNFNITFDLMLVAIAATVMAAFFLLRYYFNQHTRAISQLHKNKELLQGIIDNSPSLVFVKDLAGRYKLANKRYEKLFRLPKEEMQGKTDHEIFPPEVADNERHTDIEVMKHKKPMNFECDFPVNGHPKHYLFTKFPLIDHDDFVYAVGGIATEITERKRYEKVLKERSDFVLDLFNNAPFGYHAVDRNFVITEMNETELRWLGYRRDQVIGKFNVADLYTGETKKYVERLRERLKDRSIDVVQDLEARFIRKDGSILHVLVNTVISYDANGEFSHYKTVLFDNTARKNADAMISEN
jgi:PAS domain S-box-containing protein